MVKYNRQQLFLYPGLNTAHSNRIRTSTTLKCHHTLIRLMLTPSMFLKQHHLEPSHPPNAWGSCAFVTYFTIQPFITEHDQEEREGKFAPKGSLDLKVCYVAIQGSMIPESAGRAGVFIPDCSKMALFQNHSWMVLYSPKQSITKQETAMDKHTLTD